MIRKFAGIAVLVLAAALPALAADPTPEQRQKMAEVHQKMAECLKSTKPFSECREEMMQSCRGMTGEAACPMMGMGPGMKGHGMGMMPGQPAPEAAPKK